MEAAPAEAPAENEAPPPEAPASEPSAQVEPANHSATIRSYLAKHFIFKSWYRQIHAIVLGDYIATVLTSLPGDGGGKDPALEVCRAVRKSKRAEKVVVLYGQRSSLVC